MDPITAMIVAALAAGAATGVGGVAEQAIKDAYGGVKQWLQERYADINLRSLEKDPKSQARREVLAEELEAAGATGDEELLRKVQELSAALAKSEDGRRAVQVVGIVLGDLFAEGEVDIEDITSSGTGVKLDKGDVGSLKIKGVRAGQRPEDMPPNP